MRKYYKENKNEIVVEEEDDSDSEGATDVVRKNVDARIDSSSSSSSVVNIPVVVPSTPAVGNSNVETVTTGTSRSKRGTDKKKK